MPRYYEFDVSLAHIQPRIWRRFLLRTTSTFADLNRAIQDAFGWQDCHLWDFRLPGYDATPIAGLPGGEDYGRPTPDARQVKLNTYFTGKRVTEWCAYVYDFGDDWEHEVKLMTVHSEPESFKRRLLWGERSGPPEDAGGPPGYERIVHFFETGKDLHGEEPRELREWIGDWKPDAYDAKKASKRFDR